MTTLTLIYGFLGAGKTTYAKRLEAETGAIRFSPDEWMVRLYGGNGLAREAFDDCVQRIDALLMEQTAALLSRGINVIYDHGWWGRTSRDEAKAFAAKHGATVEIIHVELKDEATRVSRILKRNAEPDQLFLDENAIEFLWTRFEPLGDDEPHRIVISEV